MWVGSSFAMASSSHLFVTVAVRPPVFSARDALRERRHAEDPHLRLRGPRQAGLAVLLDPGNVLGANALRAHEEEAAGSEAHEVVGLRAEVGAQDAVRAVSRDHQEGGLHLFRPLQDDLEGLAHQDLGLHLDPGELLRHHLRALEVRLAELEQPLVDDVVVQLLLFLELEDLRGLHGEHVLDVAGAEKNAAVGFLRDLELEVEDEV